MKNSSGRLDDESNNQKSRKIFSDYVRQSKYITTFLEPYFPKDRAMQDVLLSLLGLGIALVIGLVAYLFRLDGLISSALAALAPIFLWGDVQGRRMAAGIIFRRERQTD